MILYKVMTIKEDSTRQLVFLYNIKIIVCFSNLKVHFKYRLEP